MSDFDPTGDGPIGANRIRTPGIGDEPVPVDAEVKVHDAHIDVEDLDRSLRPPTLAEGSARFTASTA